MNEKKRFVSMKTRIMFYTLFPVILSFFIISTALLSSQFNSLRKTAEIEFLQISRKYVSDFENKINNATNYLFLTSSTLELYVATGITDRGVARDAIKHIFSDFGVIDGSSVYFEPNAFDNRDEEYIGTELGTVTSGRISYYFYKDEGEIRFLPEALENDIEFSLPHYTDAKEANRPIYTAPTVHVVDGREIPMFTITHPIRSSVGKFIGAVTVDLFLEEMYEQLQNEEIYRSGYVVITNDREQVVYSPRFEDIGKTRQEVGLSYDLPKGNNVSVFLNSKSIINGKDALVSVQTIYIPQLESRFFISVTAPNSEINEEGIRLIAGLLTFIVVIIVLISLLLFFLIGKISAPIKELTSSIDKIANGDYNARIVGNYSGEFSIVKDSVNTMAESIANYIEESQKSLNVLKNILNGLDAFIYVTDPKTDKILFINDKMVKHFGIKDGNTIGNHCYKILQSGKEDRCEFCPCYKLDTDSEATVVWEEFNTITNRYYRNTDCYIDWLGGIKVHLQHSIDITDIKTYMNDKLEAERIALDLEHKKDKAEAAAKAKSDFLARMSHEIRTPMNAVTGMTELILRHNLPPEVHENALMIKSASSNLLSIINDILDFSKIESGMLEIVETDYSLPSMMNDVINIIRVRLMEKPIHFVVNIEPSIPALLIGDEIRIRQTLINLLSNAVKYTDEGYISMVITGEIADNTVMLKVEISDSGIGIEKENIDKLFGDFVQFDAMKNKGIEGTGLGLAISRRLCRAMGGDITAKSEYGQGSTFTVTLPQKFKNYEKFASIEESHEESKKSVLIYETRSIYGESIARTLNDLGIEYNIVENIPKLFDNLKNYSYVFVSSFMYDSINPVLLKMDNPPTMVLLADITDAVSVRNAKILALPAHALTIANLLNGVYNDSDGITTVGTSFTAPDVKVLIVDDVKANLKVAEGLLQPYEMNITLCSSGKKAIELIAENHYDLVFMDHMMPEMDGVEAVIHIRAMDGERFKTMPIIALTANAVSGMKEMFIQNGMNDFLAKPIETAKLDAILEKWIPKEKFGKAKIKEDLDERSDFVEALRSVAQLSVDKALHGVGGSVSSYDNIVKLSVRLLPENIERLDTFIETNLSSYAIEVHGLKGVMYNIGAYELGQKAQKLENASKEGNADVCKAIHPSFIEEVKSFYVEVMDLMHKFAVDDKPDGDFLLLYEALQKAEEATEFFDSVRALEVISEMNKYTYGNEIDEMLTELVHAFETFDFDEAVSLINKLKKIVL